MSNLFVIDTDVESGKVPRLAWRNEIDSSSTITATHDSASTGYLYDGMTTAKWRPAAKVSSVTFTDGFIDVDYVGIAGVNWNSAGCSVAIYDQDDTLLASASGLKDNQPLLFIITKAIYSSIKVEFTCTNTNLEVGEIYIGEALKFPRNVKVGYQPGRWNTEDEIVWQRTENNQFAGSIVRSRGTTERYQVDFLPLAFMDNEWVDFMTTAKGKAVFFLWNKDETHHAAYGHWSTNGHRFTNSFFSSVSMTIKGVA